MMGASREFSRAAVPVWGFREVGRGVQGASRVAPGKLGFNGRGEGNASLLSSHGRVSGLKTVKKDSQGLSRGAAGNPRVPRLLPGTLGNFPGCL